MPDASQRHHTGRASWNTPVSVSYVVTKFTMAPKSLLVYYMIIDKSASARIPL
jgi:hypothetical protein